MTYQNQRSPPSSSHVRNGEVSSSSIGFQPLLKSPKLDHDSSRVFKDWVTNQIPMKEQNVIEKSRKSFTRNRLSRLDKNTINYDKGKTGAITVIQMP